MRRITIQVVLIIGVALTTCRSAQAVHLDVWVHKDAVNRVDSGYFDVNGPAAITTQDRAFGYNFQENDPPFQYQVQNPGYFAQAVGNPGTSGLPDGSLVGFNVLSDLLYWNGTDPVSFSPVPAGETLTIQPLSLGSPVTVGTGTGAQPGFTLSRIGTVGPGSMHVHVNSTIIAGPSNSDPTPGIYIFQEQLTSNAPGVINSLPFWIVFNNNATEDLRGEAINFLYPNQWCGPLGGSYNTDGNWSGTIPLPGQIVPVPQSPNGQDAVANFLDNLYAASTITLDSPATVGTINFKSVPRYTLAGPSTLTLQSSTTAQINVTAGNHTISAPLVIASNTVLTAGTNSLDLQGAQTWADNTTLTVQSGTLDYAIPIGATSVGTNVTLAIAPGASVNVGGAVNPFSDGTHKVSIKNDSASGLNVNAGNVIVGRVSGAGTTSVAAAAHLTADSIIQSALVIGGTSASHSIVTIDASDSLGNPLGENAAATRSATTDGLAAVLLASSAGNADAGERFPSTASASTPIGEFASLLSPSDSLGGDSAAFQLDESRSVPEPSSLSLALACLIVSRFVHRNRAGHIARKVFQHRDAST